MRRTLIAVALATAVFAGCGGDDEETADTPAATAEATQAPAEDSRRRRDAEVLRAGGRHASSSTRAT